MEGFGTPEMHSFCHTRLNHLRALFLNILGWSTYDHDSGKVSLLIKLQGYASVNPETIS